MAGYPISESVALAVTVSAAMLLLPKMIEILVQGLLIVRDAVEAKLKRNSLTVISILAWILHC